MKPRTRVVAVVVITIFLLPLFLQATYALVPAADQGPWGVWRSETVSFGRVTSTSPPGLGVTSGDELRVLFFDDPPVGFNAIWYAERAGLQWSAHVVEANAAPGDLAIDENDISHVAFRRNLVKNPGGWVAPDMGYGKLVNGVWDLTTVELFGTSDGVFTTRIAVDSQGTPHILYHTFGGATKYATPNGSGGWIIETIASSTLLWNDIAVDSSGRPHVAYSISSGNTQFKYAVRTAPGTWQIETVSGCGIDLSLAIDSIDQPHVTCKSTNEGLLYVVKSSSSWVSEVAVSGSSVVPPRDSTDVGLDSSLDLDASGRPHVSFRTRLGSGVTELRQLHYATKVDGRWWVETVDRDGSNGDLSSIAVDSRGHPHIAYLLIYRRQGVCTQPVDSCADLRFAEPLVASAFAAAP